MNRKIDNFTKEQVQEIVNTSLTKKEVAIRLGYSSDAGTVNKVLTQYFKENNINISSLQENKNFKYTRETVFCQNGVISQHHLVRWFKKENVPYKCNICGQEPYWNNKPLTLILDHINGIHTDDRLENLQWVCPNCNQQLDTTGSRNPKRKNSAKKFYCIDCGKEVHKGTLRCASCQAKYRTIPLQDMPVTREELKQLIRTKPFTQIGKDFNITDNGIRKWCDKFNLPRTKKEIKNYSNEEWEKI